MPFQMHTLGFFYGLVAKVDKPFLYEKTFCNFNYGPYI